MKKIIAAFSIALLLGASDVWAECRDMGNIRFARGRTTGIVKGRVTASKNLCYTIKTRDGQRMTVHLTSPKKRVRFSIVPDRYDADFVEGADDVTDWEGELNDVSGTEAYIISVGVPKGADTFTLEVTIR